MTRKGTRKARTWQSLQALVQSPDPESATLSTAGLISRRAKGLSLAGAIVMLVATTSPLAHATVRGRNGRIAFRRYFNEAHTVGSIFTIKPNGTGERQVTPHRPGILTTEPDWSPNGRWIVFHRDDNNGHRRIFKIHPNGSGRTYLSSSCTGECVGDGFPAWAPHGKRIAFERDLCGTADTNLVTIYVMRADGSHARRVTQRNATCDGPHRYSSGAPQWAPNGRRLVFGRFDEKRGMSAIFTVRLDGARLRQVTPWKTDAAQPDWSPNGRWIVFYNHASSDTSRDILLVHPDGTGRHGITPGGGTWGSCSFSPNGRRVTASHSPGFGSVGNADVYTMRLDGSHRKNVTRDNGFESAPDWGSRR